MTKTSTYRCGFCKHEETVDDASNRLLIYCDGDGKHMPSPMTFVAFGTRE